jgi:hypothetical protein
MDDAEELLTSFINPVLEPNPATSYHYHQTIKPSISCRRWWRCLVLRLSLEATGISGIWISIWPRSTAAVPARQAATSQTILHCLWFPKPHDECCDNSDTGEHTRNDICCEDRVRLRSTSRSWCCRTRARARGRSRGRIRVSSSCWIRSWASGSWTFWGAYLLSAFGN